MTDKQRTIFDAELASDLAAKRLARASHPPTSHEAARDMVGSGLVQQREQEVLRLLKLHQPLTGRELDEMSGHDLHKRLAGMKRKGLIRADGERRCRVTGREVLQWVLTD